jgi:hypothetical protein
MTAEIAPPGPSERSAVWVPYVVRRAEHIAADAMPADRSEVGSLEGGVVSTATASSAA